MKLDNQATRTIAAIIIAAAFLLILFVASAQQLALAELKEANINKNYSVAHNVLEEAKGAGENQHKANHEVELLRGKLDKLDEEKDRLELELQSRLQDVASVARTIGRSGRCPLLTTSGNAPALQGIELWRLVEDCAQEGQIPPNISERVTELLAPANNPNLISRSMARLERDRKRVERDIQREEAEVAKFQKTIDEAKAVRDALQDVVVLDSTGPVSQLTRLPPVLIQIILCLVSGLFGALLLTLIFAVYPKAKFDFAKSESYWNQIGLGGLIAVAVYVVIGSGVSMLGSSRALIEDANSLSYTAIGILAGMFSERVARFLSRQAKVFDGTGGGRGNGGAGGAGGGGPGGGGGPVGGPGEQP